MKRKQEPASELMKIANCGEQRGRKKTVFCFEMTQKEEKGK